MNMKEKMKDNKKTKEHQESKNETWEKFKNCVFEILENNKAVKWVLIVLIILNAVAVIVSSVDCIQNRCNRLFYWFELVSIIIFTIEFILRLLTAKKQKYKKSYAIIDLVAILPFYLPFIPVDLRILRLLRILKLSRYNNSLGLITRVLKKEKDKLLVAFMIIIILILISSSFLYLFEYKAQELQAQLDNKPNMFSSIPATLWWAVAAFTTVGYGDAVPITVLGKLLAGFISILAIGLVALPSGIISAGLIKAIKREKFIDYPDEIKDFIETVEKLRNNIGNVCDEIAETLQSKWSNWFFKKGGARYLNQEQIGAAISYFGKNLTFFCGLSLDIVKEGWNENVDYKYTYGLRITKGNLEDLLAEKWENKIKKKFSCHSHNNFLYFNIDKKLFFNFPENESTLQAKIIEILEGVLSEAERMYENDAWKKVIKDNNKEVK